MTPYLVFLGPAGSGKGTQASELKLKYGIKQISTGDLLRDAVRHETELGLRSKAYMDKGDLVPDDLIISLVREEIERLDGHEAGFVLDGFPRTKPQAEALDGLLDELKIQINTVFVFELPLDNIVSRIGGRRVCQSCHSIYHVQFSPPKTKNICDQCGGPLIRRADDTEDKIRHRFNIFLETTEPLARYYGSKVVGIDAAKPPEQVLSQITSVLQELNVESIS